MSSLDDINKFLNDDLEDMPDQDEAQNDDDDDLFDEDGDIDADDDIDTDDDDLFAKPKIDKAAHVEIAVLLEGLNDMMANTLSGFTGMDSKRYKPSPVQTKSVAKAFVNAFPEIELGPKFMLFALVAIAYVPITSKFAKDIRITKELTKNETGTNVHNIRDKQNRKNNTNKNNNSENKPPNSNNNA